MKKLIDNRKKELITEVENIARNFRREHINICQAPIPNSFKVAEELGFFVVSASAPNELSGFTTTIDGKSMIVVNSNHPLGRQNYSIWHEIYHWYAKDGKDVSLMGDNEYSETEFKAEAFASEILLEKKVLERELQNLGYKSISKNHMKYLKNEDIVKLQNKFKVSYRAMLTRIITISGNKDINNRYGVAASQEKIIQFNIKCGFDGGLEQPTLKPYISESLFEYLTFNLEKGRVSSIHVERFIEFIEGEIN
ncbi:ImmA/IrrE family metallo-endopeptidase [Carnobacterium maltaromaticum]|uniref:ImmA/IrrE family metallo-endopeptidase n=1 Tax=Carnobacterium maltaromaticum TaxID=2751 RepID=UPI00298AF8D4|nr:ImmA/IrrE family metallo-endopeptidase [Carnobacterium maltaromaticum]MDW5524640.1 ImmA/IrrE family metallo-endopeptidase [Carnobacterium maltaromaticum]